MPLFVRALVEHKASKWPTLDTSILSGGECGRLGWRRISRHLSPGAAAQSPRNGGDNKQASKQATGSMSLQHQHTAETRL